MPDLVRFEMADGVARVTLDRPDKRNALSRALLAELAEAIDRVAADDSVRVLVLGGNGSVFCAGMDLGEMQERATLDAEAARGAWREDSEAYRDLIAAIVRLPFPTIAAVGGPAVAGGVGIVLACDLVLASEAAWFELPEPRRGVVAAMVTPLLVHRVGMSLASRMLLGLQRIDAAEGLRTGLCHAVVPVAELDGTIDEWTRTIRGGSPTAMRLTKSFLVTTGGLVGGNLPDGMTESAAARETDDAREGLAAFLEKRSPNWAPE